MITCYLGLGSNLRSPERQLRQAIHALRKMHKTIVIKISNLYFGPAFGRRTQPPYCNCVIEIKTTLPPKKLLQYCKLLEKQQRRSRKIRWGARTLDIDILLYGDRHIQHPDLTIPHPRIFERPFVLLPLLSIAPHFQLPTAVCQTRQRLGENRTDKQPRLMLQQPLISETT